MSFAPSDKVPAITWADLRRLNGLTRSLRPGEPREPGRLSSRPLQTPRAHHRKVLDRYLLSVLKPAQFAVLSAITARTFGFNKALEAIALKSFCEGIPGEDEDGLPYFGGINLAVSTIRVALDELAGEHLIERYQIVDNDRPIHAYMPVSWTVFHQMVYTSVDLEEVPESISSVALVDRKIAGHEARIFSSWTRQAMADAA